MKPINILQMRKSDFTPVTRTYTTGTAVTETVPTGATNVTIRAVGGGGSGGHDDTLSPTGAGSGAYSVKTVAVVGGNTFTYTVGQGGPGVTNTLDGNNGTDSTVSSAAPSVSMTAGKGFGGTANAAVGAGGTATGGTTNTAGNPGVGQTGGAAVYSTYGAGSNAKIIATGTSLAGGGGVVIFEYT